MRRDPLQWRASRVSVQILLNSQKVQCKLQLSFIDWSYYTYRLGFYTTEALNQGKNRWMMCLMQSLGKYNINCYASESQLQEYISGKFREFLAETRDDEDFPIKLAVKAIGLQLIDPHDPTVQEIDLKPEAKVWVLNESTHITERGTCIDPTKSPFIWMGGLRKATKKISDNIACEAYASDVSPHNLNPAALTELVDALHDSYCNNFPSALFVLGVHLLHLHYELLLQLVGGVPVGVLYGDVQTGKSTAMEAALSLLGTQESHYRKRCSDVRFLRITSQTTLGLVLDDLTQAHGLVEKIMVLFDGKAVESGGETFRPRTSFMTALNMSCFKLLVKHHRYK